jgi:energy-coupling factor transport system substrate-specific component
MTRHRHHLFSLHELLIMAALAALGGVSGSAVSMIRAAVHAVVVVPGGMQFAAGVHVLWLVLAVGLVRKPGAATATGLFKGMVELLSGNPHGLLVVMYSGLAGVAVDAVWLLIGGRDRPITYVLAGGVGAASNVLVLVFVASFPTESAVVTGSLVALAGVAFISGALLAGLLGWWLLEALRLAGVVGARQRGGVIHGSSRRRAGFAVLAAAIALACAAVYLASGRTEVRSADGSEVSPSASGRIVSPQ